MRGLIDGTGVLWSASLMENKLLRFDTTTGSGACIADGQSYGLGIDSNDTIWNARWTDGLVTASQPDGTPLGTSSSGGSGSRGVVVPPDDDGWIANSASDTVTRLTNAGTLIATISVGDEPTGVAVDGAGKVWVTSFYSASAMRIDPATNAVDFTVDLGVGAGPHNYSDMTGSTLTAPPDTGSWTIVHDTTIPGAAWGNVSSCLNSAPKRPLTWGDAIVGLPAWA